MLDLTLHYKSHTKNTYIWSNYGALEGHRTVFLAFFNLVPHKKYIHLVKLWSPGGTSQIASRRRTDVGCWSQGRQILPTLGRRWADGGLPTTIHVRFLYILPTLGRRWADVGPTVDFYSRWRRAIIGDLGKLRKKLLIMVYLKVIFQSAHKF